MSDLGGMLAGGGGMPPGMMLPGHMPQELKDRMEQETKRQCRVLGVNTALALVQAGAFRFGDDTSNDARFAEFRGLAGKFARWIEDGVVPN